MCQSEYCLKELHIPTRQEEGKMPVNDTISLTQIVLYLKKKGSNGSFNTKSS